MEKLLYNTKEASQMLSVSPPTVRRLVRAGLLESVKIGDSPKFTKEAMLDFIARGGTTVCRASVKK